MKNANKYLVTWIEGNGFIRGQATQSRAEADRLFEHVATTDASYCEVARIGPRVRHFDRTSKKETVQ
ncbi:MAG: hypothetical protein KGJ13_06335 [Patescibacteria group bacterium]|nr:hypothetical protein [Patescibacteria group bacterium]